MNLYENGFLFTFIVGVITIVSWPIIMMMIFRWGKYPKKWIILLTGFGIGEGIYLLAKASGFRMLGDGLIFPLAGAAFTLLIFNMKSREAKKK